MPNPRLLSWKCLLLLAAFTLGWGRFPSCGLEPDRTAPLAVGGDPAMRPATQGVSYGDALYAVGGERPYAWDLTAGALPAGLALDPATGGISGTPSIAGSASFSVRVTDSGSRNAVQDKTLLVNPPLSVATTALPDAVETVDYAVNLVPAGGTAPVQWSLTSGALPAGLALSGTTGRIAGVPAGPGASAVTVRARDVNGALAEAALTLTVQADPGIFPRLVVADDGPSPSIRIWDDADALAADRACDAVPAGTSAFGVLRLAFHGNRLFAATRDPSAGLAVWDGAATLSGGAVPSATVPASELAAGVLADAFDLSVDQAGNLWIATGEIRLFLHADRMDSSATCRARFVRQDARPLHAAAYDAVGRNLFAASREIDEFAPVQDPDSRTGAVTVYGAGARRTIPSSMVLVGDRFYVGTLSPAAGEGFVEVRNDLLLRLPATVVVLGAASGLGPVAHLDVRNDVLVATMGGAPGRVNLYANAAAISGDVDPIASVSDAAMVHPRKSHLAKDGSLYVLVDDGILVFRNAASAPVFACKITIGLTGPSDFLLIE